MRGGDLTRSAGHSRDNFGATTGYGLQACGGYLRFQGTHAQAGESFGATRRQLLWKVELPAALPSIMAGLTQCIMLSLSMVVFATLIGAPSLGNPVNKALANRNIPLGIEAGLAIVVLAIILDRMLAVRTGARK